MRKGSELLGVLLDNAVLFESSCLGLCMMCSMLEAENFITSKEYTYLINYISENGPIYRDILGYYWTYGIWEPREKWLKEQIEKLKSQGL